MRALCKESGRASGLLIAPKRRVRCLVCGNLVGFEVIGEHLVVKRHYRTFTLPSGDRRWSNPRF